MVYPNKTLDTCITCHYLEVVSPTRSSQLLFVSRYELRTVVVNARRTGTRSEDWRDTDRVKE